MSRIAYAVIGAHYGDEGKGQVTAWLCRRLMKERPDSKVLNVLTNGGCQRGHTVHAVLSETREARHVFKHFGSGTFYGAHTHFGPEFILNPMEFVREDGELSKAGFRPVCSCGWNNRVQLPVDVAVNQYLERVRAGRGMEHGSVGFGINETVLRYERGMGRSFVAMVADAEDDEIAFEKRITELSHDYAHDRIIEELGNESDFNDFESKFYDYLSAGTVRHYIDDLLSMSHRINVSWHSSRAYDHDYFVFENGQGLKIGQQCAESFFNCTPSDTGAFSVLRAMHDMDLIGDRATDRTKVDKVVPFYVSRTYMTRHGTGPFPVPETKDPPFGEKPDETNRPNDFQGSIRYAEFHGGEFNAMLNDLFRFRSTCVPQCDVAPKLAATHLCYESSKALGHFPWVPDVMFSSDEPVDTSCDRVEIF